MENRSKNVMSCKVHILPNEFVSKSAKIYKKGKLVLFACVNIVLLLFKLINMTLFIQCISVVLYMNCVEY